MHLKNAEPNLPLTGWLSCDNIFISDPSKTKTHAQPCQWLTSTLGPTCPAVKCFIMSGTLLYRVCTHEKGDRYVLKARSLFDTQCRGWATPALCSTFSRQTKEKRHLLCTHPTPSMENSTSRNESQQWSLIQQQFLMSNISTAVQALKTCRAVSDQLTFLYTWGIISLPIAIQLTKVNDHLWRDMYILSSSCDAIVPMQVLTCQRKGKVCKGRIRIFLWGLV